MNFEFKDSIVFRLPQKNIFLCNSSSPLPVDIICFILLRIVISLTVLKRIYYVEVFKPLQGMFVPLSQPM